MATSGQLTRRPQALGSLKAKGILASKRRRNRRQRKNSDSRSIDLAFSFLLFLSTLVLSRECSY